MTSDPPKKTAPSTFDNTIVADGKKALEDAIEYLRHFAYSKEGHRMELTQVEYENGYRDTHSRTLPCSDPSCPLRP